MKKWLFVLVCALLFLLSPWMVFSQSTWNGSISVDWTDPSNWTPFGVPGAGTNVTVPVTAFNNPSLTFAGANPTINNLSIESTATLTIGAQSLTVQGNLTTTTPGGNYFSITSGTLQVNGTSTIQGNITAGAGTISLTGAVTVNTANLTISTLNGPITFGNTVTGSAGTENLTVSAGAGLVSFGGAVGGGPTLSSLSVTAGSVTLANNVSTTGSQTYTAPVTLTGNVALGANSVSFGSTVTGGGNDLALTCAAAITLVLGDITGVNNFSETTGGGATVSGTLATTGTQTFSSAVTLGGATTFNAGGLLTLGATTAANFNLVIQGSGGATIASATLGTGTLDLSGVTGGTITVSGALTAQALTTVGNAYNVALNGGGTITNAVTFSNSGTLTIGAGFAFTGGATDTAGAKSFGTGTISASNAALNFGLTAVILTNTTTFNAGSGLVTLGATTAANFNLALIGSGGAMIASAALGTGTLDLSGVTSGTITVSGALTAQALTTVGNAYNVALNGGGTVTNAVTFSNSGTLTIGAGFAFTGGATDTAGAKSFGTGTISASNAALNFGVTGVTLTGNSTFSAGSGLVTLGATTAVNFNLVIQGSGGATIASATLGMGTFDLTGVLAGATVTVTGNLTVQAISTAAAAYNVALNNGGTVTAATSFLNTGTVSIANGLQFTNGIDTTTGPSGTILGFWLRTFGNTIKLGAVTLLAGNVWIDSTDSGTFAGNSITIASASGAGSTLNLWSGSFPTTVAGALSVANLTLHLNLAASVGQMSFNGPVTVTGGITTVPQAYQIQFTAGGTITNAATFTNTGALTIPAGFTFTGGATKTVAGAKNFAGTISSTNSALNFGVTPVTLTNTTTFSAGSGLITLGATTSANFNLVIQGSGGATIVFVALGTGTFDLSGATGGTITVTGNLAAGSLTTGASNYSVALNGGGTISGAGVTTFSNTGTVTFGTAAGFQFNNGVDTSSGPTNTIVGGWLRTFSAPITLGPTTITSAGGNWIDTTNWGTNMPGTTLTMASVSGAGLDLTLASGSATTTVSGAVSVRTLTLHKPAAGYTGTMILNGLVTLSGFLSTVAQPYDIQLNGGGSVVNAVTFTNTGALTIGAGFAFSGGMTATAVSARNIAGVVSAAGVGVLNLNVGMTTITGNATLGGLSTGQITLNNVLIDNGFTLTLGAAAATPVVVNGTVDGPALGLTSNLTINTAGAVTVSGQVGANDIGTVTVTNSGGTTFSLLVKDTTTTLTATTGTIAFNGGHTSTNLTTAAAGFNVTLNGGGTVTNAVTFSNTGTLTIGAAGYVFTNGANGASLSGKTFSGGTISSTNSPLNFGGLGATTLNATTTFSAGTGVVLLSAVTALNFSLVLVNSGGATIASAALGTGTLDLTGVSGGTVTVGNLTAGALATAGNAYNVTLNGGGTIGAATTFLNTGTLTIGSGVTTTFTGGVTATAPSGKNLSGTIATANAAINFSVTSDTLSGNTTLSAGTGAITLDGVTAVNFNLALQNSGGATISSATLGTGTFDLSGVSGGTVTVSGALNAGAMTTAAANYAIVLNGGGTISGAGVTTFSNTGALTIPLGFTFTGGATKTVAGAKNFAGTISSTNSALNFGVTAVTLTNTTTFSAGSGLITLGATTAANFNLVIQGSGGATIASASLGTGTLNLTGVTGGTISSGLLTAQALTTAAAAYNVTLSGGGTVTNAVTFNNTGTLTIGAGFTFTNGATDTAGAKSFAGTIASTNAALSFGITAITLTGPTTFNAGSAFVTLGATTSANFDLVIVGSGGATIASAALGTGTLNLVGVTAGAIVTVTGALTAQALSTAAVAYGVTLGGGGTVTNAVIFSNTGALTIGAGFTFTGGATKTVAGAKNFAGVISATNNALNFGVTAVTLTASTTFNAGSGLVTLGATTGPFDLIVQGSGGATIASANIGAGAFDLSGATGGTIAVTGALAAQSLTTGAAGYGVTLSGGGTVTNAVTFNNTGTLAIGAGFTFTNGATGTAGPKSFAGTIASTNQPLNFGITAVTLTAPTTFNAGGGLVTLGPTTSANFDLVIVGSGGATIASAALGTGTLNLVGVTAGTISCGALTAATLSTAAAGYNVTLGGGGTVTNAVTFSNTGALTIGAGFTFINGATDTVGAKSFGAGTIASTNSALNFGVTAVTLTGNVTFDAGSGLVTLGATSGAFNLALAGSGGASIASANIGTGTFDLSGVTAGATVTVGGALTAQGLSTAAAAYTVVLGGGGTVTNAVTFSNTGALTIGSGFVFSGGVTATAGSAKTITGVISAAAGVINLGGAGPITVTGITTIGGASTGQITLAAVVINPGFVLTVGTGFATPVVTSTLDGAGPGTSDITFDTTSTVTVTGAITSNIGTLTNASAVGTVDIQGNNFTIATLANAGIFRLTGTQATQAITAIGFNGTVQYYGAGGTIQITVPFNSLEIAGAETFTLANAIQIGPTPGPAGTGSLTITSGTLDVSGANFTITVNGDWNNAAGNANFNGRNGTVIFVKPAPGPINVSGDNTWFVFECQVNGTTIVFQAGKTQTMANVAGAIFRVKTGAGNINITSSLPNPPPPLPPAGYWLFTLNPAAGLDMNNVTVDASNATPFDAPVPPGVTLTAPPPIRCPGWKNVNLVIFSGTVDKTSLLLPGANGKIDRILVRTQFNLNKSPASFLGFKVSVTGYALTTAGGDAGTVYNWTDPALLNNEFYIMLQEQPFLDTGAQPVWKILQNATLVDFAVGDKYVQLPGPTQTPDDNAAPILGYTLAIVGNNQIFVHFSEYVYQNNLGGVIQPGQFTFPGAVPALNTASITRITTLGNGTSEALLNLNRAITADDVLLPTKMQVNPAVSDAATAPNPVLFAAGGHRITDIGLGQLSDGLIEPVFAHDQTQSGPFPGGIGLIQVGGFDGSKWLRNKQDITMEGHIHTASVYPALGGTTVLYDIDVPLSLRSASGLWSPPFEDRTLQPFGFSGLVPTDRNGDSSALSLSELPSSTNQLRDFLVPGTTPKAHDGATLNFFFLIGGALNLLTARVVDPLAIDWYRHITPWAFDLRDLRAQRGGVQILKNVINPDKGEVTTLQFTQSSSGNVTVTVFDLSGSIIRVLVRQNQGAGDYGVTWDGTNRSGAKVTRGLYFIRVVGPGMDEIRKVLVVR